jgi:hypothetical protein
MSTYLEERQNRVQLLLRELRECIQGPITGTATGNTEKKALALALNDRINVESNEKGDINSKDVIREFDGILEKLQVSGGRFPALATSLEHNKNMLLKENSKVNPSKMDYDQYPTSYKLLRLLLALSNSPTSCLSLSKDTESYILKPNEAGTSSGNNDTDTKLIGSTGDNEDFKDDDDDDNNDNDTLNEWLTDFKTKDGHGRAVFNVDKDRNLNDWRNSDSDSDYDTDNDNDNDNESNLDFNNINNKALLSDDYIQNITENLEEKTRAKTTAATQLAYGAHISHYKVPSKILHDKYDDFYTDSNNNANNSSIMLSSTISQTRLLHTSVFYEYDICKMVTEMFLGCPNDIFERRDIDWKLLFIGDIRKGNLKREGKSFNRYFIDSIDLRNECRAFCLSHYAKTMRLPNLGPTVLQNILIYFTEIGSDMHICREFSNYYESSYEPNKSRTSDVPMKKLMEGVKSQISQLLSYLVEEITIYQELLLAEADTKESKYTKDVDMMNDNYNLNTGAFTSLLSFNENDNIKININSNLDDKNCEKTDERNNLSFFRFNKIAPPHTKCSLISLYFKAHKWRNTLKSVVAFIETLLHFRNFQLPPSISSSSGSIPREISQNYEFLMTYKIIHCLQEGICASGFDMTNDINSLFKKENINGNLLTMRKIHYLNPYQNKNEVDNMHTNIGPYLWSYSIFERFIFTHFIHYFVEICCKSLAFVKDQNYILKAGDVFSKSKATFLCSRQGGLMKIVLPYIVILDNLSASSSDSANTNTHKNNKKNQNNTIKRYSKMNSIGKVSWKEQIKDIKCLSDYKTSPSVSVSSSSSSLSASLVSVGDDANANVNSGNSNIARLLIELSNDMKGESEHACSFEYISEYLQILQQPSFSSIPNGSTSSGRVDRDIVPTNDDTMLLNITPTPKLHEILLLNPILSARKDVQIAVVEGIWEHFSLNSYFHFLRSLYLMGNEQGQLFVAFEDIVSNIFNLNYHQQKLPDMISRYTNILSDTFMQQIKSILPVVGVLHSVCTFDERHITNGKKFITTSTIISKTDSNSDSTLNSPGSMFLSQLIECMNIEMHLSYPLSEIFNENILLKYNKILKFLLRLSITELVLKVAWKEGTTRRKSVELLSRNIVQKVVSMHNVNISIVNESDNEKALIEPKTWYSFLRKGRLALGLVLRACSDIRSYYLRLLHSNLWGKFSQTMWEEDSEKENVYRSGNTNKTRKLKLTSVTEVKICHQSLVTNIEESAEQFNEILKTFLFSSSQFAEAIIDATREEVSCAIYFENSFKDKDIKESDIPNREYTRNTLIKLQTIAYNHKKLIEKHLNVTENNLKVFRNNLDAVVRMERVSHIFNGFSELRNMLQ